MKPLGTILVVDDDPDLLDPTVSRAYTGRLVFAGLLLTFEGQHLVLSRLALLDIFLAFFVLCAVSCQVASGSKMQISAAARRSPR